MEAVKLQTVADLAKASQHDERIELVNGEIVKRPMARPEHALAQSDLAGQFFPLSRRPDDKGWWIMTEISVEYSEHHCPIHDLAGWRKERVPERPARKMQVVPDWVCEITSPGHERKDAIVQVMRLQAFKVPYYWVLSPESRTLIVYALDGEHYRVVQSLECRQGDDRNQLVIPPFEEMVVDLGYVFGVS